MEPNGFAVLQQLILVVANSRCVSMWLRSGNIPERTRAREIGVDNGECSTPRVFNRRWTGGLDLRARDGGPIKCNSKPGEVRTMLGEQSQT